MSTFFPAFIVRITHLPTGVTVQASNSYKRSEFRSMRLARKVLRARLAAERCGYTLQHPEDLEQAPVMRTYHLEEPELGRSYAIDERGIVMMLESHPTLIADEDAEAVIAPRRGRCTSR